MPRPKQSRETETIRYMIHQRLQQRALADRMTQATAHLDEDALSAFVEGRLSEAESKPFVSHLVACTYCRRITAHLIRLESELRVNERVGETDTPVTPEEPGRIRRLLENLASRVLPSEDEAVFAYHAPAEDFQQEDEADRNKEKEGDKEGGPNERSQQ